MKTRHSSFVKIVSFLVLILFMVLINPVIAQNKKGYDPVLTRKVIEKMNAEFMAATEKADADAMEKGYSKDAIVFQPNQPMAEGTEAIKKSFSDLTKMGKVKIILKLKDVFGSGNIAVATGRYEIEITPEGKEPIKDNGKYVNVWQMQKDGTWKLKRDIWNTDIPQSALQP
jgi:uncharacterized protein (TIGR02246 family)